MPTFVGQSALIIGGSSGMGRGAARAFAARGGDVWVTSRTAAALPAATDAIRSGLVPADGADELGRIDGVVCDLTDLDSVRQAVGRPPRLDHLVITAAPGRGVTDREFFDGKFWGSQVACAVAADRLSAEGSILLVSGGLAVRPIPGQWSVTCAFAAVEALARALAVELAPRRVNCIRPGLFDTGTWAGMEPSARDKFFAGETAKLPAGRPATGEDFGDATIGLLGAGYLTGQVVVVDGGAAVSGGLALIGGSSSSVSSSGSGLSALAERSKHLDLTQSARQRYASRRSRDAIPRDDRLAGRPGKPIGLRGRSSMIR